MSGIWRLPPWQCTKRVTASDLGLMFSDQDSDLLLKTWRLDKDGYARRGVSGGKKIHAHREVLFRMLGFHTTNTLVADHVDRNKLNNRRENLRIVDKSINGLNRGIPGHNTSGIKGISYRRSNDSWAWHLSFKGITYQGNRKSREKAEAALTAKRLELGCDDDSLQTRKDGDLHLTSVSENNLHFSGKG